MSQRSGIDVLVVMGIPDSGGFLGVFRPRLPPLCGRDGTLGTVNCVPFTNLDQHRSVHRVACDDRLPGRQSRELVEDTFASCFDTLFDCVLIGRVLDLHDELGPTLRQHIGVDLPGTLADDPDTKSKLPAL